MRDASRMLARRRSFKRNKHQSKDGSISGESRQGSSMFIWISDKNKEVSIMTITCSPMSINLFPNQGNSSAHSLSFPPKLGPLPNISSISQVMTRAVTKVIPLHPCHTWVVTRAPLPTFCAPHHSHNEAITYSQWLSSVSQSEAHTLLTPHKCHQKYLSLLSLKLDETSQLFLQLLPINRVITGAFSQCTIDPSFQTRAIKFVASRLSLISQ